MSERSACPCAQAVPTPQHPQSSPPHPTPERQLVCWDEASASSLLTHCAELLAAHPQAWLLQHGGRGCLCTTGVLGKRRAGSWLFSPLLFPLQPGDLTSVTGAQYLHPVQAEWTRRKRSRAQLWTFISEVQVFPEQLRCMMFGTGT